MNISEGKTLLIANPAAQRGNGMEAAHIAHDLLVEWLGRDNVGFQLTEKPGHAAELAESARGTYATVIVLGGDGVVHEAVNGLMRIPADERPRFGLVPVGSGNDYARTLGMSEVVPDAVVQFLEASEVAVDIGCCNGEFFAETLSFGLDAAIALDTVERRARTGEQGTILYLKSGIDQLFHHLDTFTFTATLDGERTLSAPIHMLAVQIGQTYGGGFRICPDADPTDGLFDICYAEAPMSIPEATFKFLRAKDARHTKFKNIFFERATRIELSFDRRPPCQFDGEAHIADSYSISIDRRALRVLAPALG
ncbi:MAG: YegS/Rv2252/BmrU family lipid kinase [Eggerthellaceae bacterium]|nr:YegS/Rv2252/BmrU family lipid kinase [Eggerthellaceae bacterium]